MRIAASRNAGGSLPCDPRSAIHVNRCRRSGLKHPWQGLSAGHRREREWQGPSPPETGDSPPPAVRVAAASDRGWHHLIHGPHRVFVSRSRLALHCRVSRLHQEGAQTFSDEHRATGMPRDPFTLGLCDLRCDPVEILKHSPSPKPLAASLPGPTITLNRARVAASRS